jgi:WD40 repeat protein
MSTVFPLPFAFLPRVLLCIGLITSIARSSDQTAAVQHHASSNESVVKFECEGEAVCCAKSVPQITEKPAQHFSIGYFHAYSIAVSCHGEFVYVADTTGEVVCRNLDLQKNVWKRQSWEREAIESVAIKLTEDQKLVVIASNLRPIAAWRAADGSPIRVADVANPSQYTASLAVRRRGRNADEIAVTTTGDQIVSWNPHTGKVVHRIPVDSTGVSSLAIAQQAEVFAVGMIDGRVVVREYPSGNVIFEIQPSECPISGLAVIANGTALLAGSDDQISCWDISTPMRQRWTASARCVSIDGFALSPDEKYVLCSPGQEKGRIVVRDVQDGRIVLSRRHGSGNWRVFAFSNDGTVLVTAGEKRGTVAIWPVRNSKRSESE